MFFKILPGIGFLVLLISLCRADEEASPATADNGWTEVCRKTGLVIYCRERKDSAVREYKATGDILAPTWVVKNVIDDVEDYAHFMPYITESTVLAQDGEGLITYQRFSTPLITDRDYILRIHFESRRVAGGGVLYCNRWKATTGVGPEEKKKVTRVKINEGYWLLEPVGEMTRATYLIFTDPGGAIPAMAINYGNKNAIPMLFAAVQKQTTVDKYREKKPK